MMLTQYSPKDVVVSFNGINITGFDETDMITITRNQDLVNETVGAQGDLQLTVVHDRTGQVDFTLLQNSNSNVALEAFLLGTAITNKIIIAEIAIVDMNTGASYLAHNAYLKSMPDYAFGSDNNSRTWSFGCEQIELITPQLSGLSIG